MSSEPEDDFEPNGSSSENPAWHRLHELSDEVIRMNGLLIQARKEADVAFAALNRIEKFMQTAKSIRHLLREDRLALSGNADAGIDGAIEKALAAIRDAENETNRIPF